MKKYIYLILLILLSKFSHAQLLKSKHSIYFAYSTGNFTGSETVSEGNYISPSLFSNYKQLSGFSIKGVTNWKDHLSYGLNLQYHSSKDWESSEYKDFNDSEVQLYSLMPSIRIHNEFKNTGFSNRFQLYLECGPTMGIANLKLSNISFDIQPTNGDISSLKSESKFFYGLRGESGIEYAITQNFACYVSYSYDVNWVSSKLYNDSRMKRSLLNFGVVLKLSKNKYFYQ